MMNTLREELVPILESIAIESPVAFKFRNQSLEVNPVQMSHLPGFPGHALPALPLVRDLQATLYQHCYLRRPQKDLDELPSSDTIPDESFLHRLSLSNRSSARWEAGWTIYSVALNGQVWLIKGDRQRSAMPGEFISAEPPGSAPRAGASVTLQCQRESSIAQPGFYFCYGEYFSDVWDQYSLLRTYFHATSYIAPELLDYLTSQLNRYQVPFSLKALNHPTLYSRPDAMVLYVARRYYEIAMRIVHQLPLHVASALRESTPMFTLFILPGVGIAEDPNTGESFGMHRCRLVAEGITDAWMKHSQATVDRLSAIDERFSQNGCSLELPYLSPGSVDFGGLLHTVEFAHA